MAEQLPCCYCGKLDHNYMACTMFAGNGPHIPGTGELQAALADRDRRIEALVAEVDSWKASYMALAPDHDVAMLRANSRIEALTKALRALTGCTKEVTNALKACAMFTITDQAARQIALKMVKEGEEAVDTANALLASAAGAEGEA